MATSFFLFFFSSTLSQGKRERELSLNKWQRGKNIFSRMNLLSGVGTLWDFCAHDASLFFKLDLSSERL